MSDSSLNHHWYVALHKIFEKAEHSEGKIINQLFEKNANLGGQKEGFRYDSILYYNPAKISRVEFISKYDNILDLHPDLEEEMEVYLKVKKTLKEDLSFCLNTVSLILPDQKYIKGAYWSLYPDYLLEVAEVTPEDDHPKLSLEDALQLVDENIRPSIKKLHDIVDTLSARRLF